MKILINADDFGYSPAINQTIIELYQKKRIHSASLLVTLPTSSDATSLALEHCLPTGVHLDLSKGKAIEHHKKSSLLIDADGNFLPTRVMLSRVILGLISLNELEAELRAQIELALGNGITPSHLDSQGHWQIYPPLHHLVCKLATEYHIPRVRSGNYRRVIFPTPFIRIRPPKPHPPDIPWETDYLLSLHHWINHRKKSVKSEFIKLAQDITSMPGSIEIVTHPGLYPDPDFPKDTLPAYRRALETAFLSSNEFGAILQTMSPTSINQLE